MIVPNQIFRHFKGGLYLILSLAKSEDDPQGECQVIYRSLNGDDKVWSRKQSDFESNVPEDKFNPTGQIKRFELVTNLRNQLSMASTQSLVDEIKTRADSPFNDLDMDGFNSRVKNREYIVGELVLSQNGEGTVLQSIMTADSQEKAIKFIENHPERVSSRVRLYKSVLIEVGL